MQIGLVRIEAGNHCLNGTKEYNSFLLDEAFSEEFRIEILTELARTLPHKKQERLCIQTFISMNENTILNLIKTSGLKNKATTIIAQIKNWKIEA